MLETLAEGQAKMHVILKGLALRKAHPQVFHGGKYQALYAEGGCEENAVAFSLSAGGTTVVAVAPRLFARTLERAAPRMFPIGEFWGESVLPLPEGEFENVLTGARHAGGRIPLSILLREFPVALLATRP